MRMMEEYIHERENVVLFVLLVDSRHPLSEDDINCFNSLIETGKEIAIVATKADKLNQKMKSAYKKNIENIFKESGDLKIFLTSSLDKRNIELVVDYIEEVMK